MQFEDQAKLYFLNFKKRKSLIYTETFIHSKSVANYTTTTNLKSIIWIYFIIY